MKDWKFNKFTINHPTCTVEYDPNTWIIKRVNGVAAIITAEGNSIDEPTDNGQEDLELILWGIGWLHATFTGDREQ